MEYVLLQCLFFLLNCFINMPAWVMWSPTLLSIPVNLIKLGMIMDLMQEDNEFQDYLEKDGKN